MRQILYISVFASLLGACTDFPQMDAVVSESAKRAEYPTLIPGDALLSKRNDGQITEETGRQLLARAENLRARARVLRSITQLDDDTRRRLSPLLRRLGG